MGAIGALVLKILHEMAYVLVASKLAISIVAKVSENLPLKYWSILTVALGAENFERSVFVLVIWAASKLVN